ncbi:ABC transporter permease [Rhodococcus globerulus]|uniref:ABC transporter permease n=1 Tax=Rhodococcus globerulus TaxID=33008 RepID=A0ABU4C3X4_RHOGO|nr:ABC transporter permease [Rhodococcus globerulus]MDV6271205.1 ABC transporter permease [Rhodococcus globerulus]
MSTALRIKLIATAPILLLVTFGAFIMVNLAPGDPTVNILGDNASPDDYIAMRQELGLDDPLFARYLSWLGNVFQGNFGTTLVPPQQEVATVLARAIPVNLELAVLTLVMALAISIPVGMWSAYRPGSRFDRAVSTTSFALLSIPNFLLAVLLVLLLAVNWQIFPIGGWARPTEEGWGANLYHAFLPALALAIEESLVFARLLRSDMHTTLQEDFIVASRAKGMPTWHVLVREALRPSSFSVLTLTGISVGRIIGGTFVIEQVFALPGLGQAIVNGALTHDYRIVQGGVVVVAVVYLVISIVVDALYGYLDPRTRHA